MIFLEIQNISIDLYNIQNLRNRKTMSSNENTANNIIYISNFPKKLPKEVLQSTLNEYGVVLSLNIIYKHDFSFAFAQFDDIRDAAFAVKELNQKLYHGMNLKVQYKNKKGKEKELEIEENIKKEIPKNSQSPNMTLQTTCSILTSKPTQPINTVQKNLHHNRKRKNSRQEIQSDFSLSRSRSRQIPRQRQRQRQRSNSRSRRKTTRRERHYDDWLPYHPQQARGSERSLERYKNRIHQHRSNSMGGQIIKMHEMVKKMSKNLRRLEQRLQSFLVSPNYDYRQQCRRRN